MSRNGRLRPYDAAAHGTAILVGHFVMPRGTAYLEHRHPVHQLACPTRGLVRVRTERGVWLLPPSRALWIPAQVPHTTESAGDAVMRSAYVDPAGCPGIAWREPTVVSATPLLRALVDHLTRADLTADARSRAEQVLLDELRPLPVTSLHVPRPRDPRARTSPTP
ncbi:AraC family ligand binding domain-containing protein [Streptomyces sp. NPDC001843]|uniref:AraC family ligand binding domain-containing protein n=1 Tax=Streptomyces sp. NPDC001843 TaxID=3364617 RepID=UPI0036C3D351